MKTKHIPMFFLICALLLVVQEVQAQTTLGFIGDLVRIDWAKLGNTIIDVLIDFIELIVQWIADNLLPLIGVEPDYEGLFEKLAWIEDNSKKLNDLIPVFSGIAVIAGGVVAQWVVIILRYVFGWFVGG